MKIWNDYIIANTLNQATGAAAASFESTQYIAGGTDLLLEIQQGRHAPVSNLVDVNQIPELKLLCEEDEHIYIGAAVAVSTIAASPLIIKHARAVSEATGLIGGPQVRNVATLGGNVAHALPAADGMISLVAMDARARIACSGEMREQPILTLFKGPGISALDKCELISGFLIARRQPGEGSAFRRVMRPQGVALPILNCAVWLKRGEQNLVEDVRVVFGPSGPVPSRAHGVEAEIRCKPFTEKSLEAAVQAIQSTVKFRTSKRRATAEYRYQLAGELFKQTIRAAWERTLE